MPTCPRPAPPSRRCAPTSRGASPRSPARRSRRAAANGGRCCRYELSADSNFIAARHPELDRTWILGGGSGHGFKHGPALAERVSDALRGGEPLPERFGLGARAVGRSFRTAGSGAP
jgi:sarcosine oxidase